MQIDLTPSQHKWLVEAGKETVKNLGQSAFFMSLLTPSFHKDPLCALQLGYAILKNKPMYFAVEEGTLIPDVVKRLAVKIVVYKKDDKQSFEDAVEAITSDFKAGAYGKATRSTH